MKLVILTAVKEFEKDIKLLLKKAELITLSHIHIAVLNIEKSNYKLNTNPNEK